MDMVWDLPQIPARCFGPTAYEPGQPISESAARLYLVPCIQDAEPLHIVTAPTPSPAIDTVHGDGNRATEEGTR